MPPDDDDFDPKECPTAPDLGHICPACEGEGTRLVDLSSNDPKLVRKVRRKCSVCWGKKRLTSEELARYLARPRT